MLAYELARRGLRTALLEKDGLPRYKTCGGGVQQRVVKMVDCDIAPVVRAQVTSFIFTHRLTRPITRQAPHPVVQMVMRDAFDNFLVERAAAAGAEVRDRCRVNHVEQTAGEVTIETAQGRLRAPIVAGADGANSRVSRDLGLVGLHDLDLAVEGEIEAPAGVRERWLHTALIDLGSLPSGYGWLFPKGDQLSVGAGGPMHYRSRFQAYYQRLLRYLGLEQAKVARYSGHQLTLRKPGTPIVRGRALLLGDAAGLVDPFTGEGLYGAVKSGLLAADPVARAIERGPDALMAYERAVDREIMPEMLEARIILRVFDRMPGLCHRLVGTGDLMWRNLVRLMLGDTNYLRLGRGKMRYGWRALDRVLSAAAG